MILTDKCEEDFEKWLTDTKDISHEHYVTWVKFDILSDSAKYGVYVDFFDSVGIEIEIYKDYDMSDFPSNFNGWIYYFEQEDNNKWFETRQEARQKAIEKANEIYNKL